MRQVRQEGYCNKTKKNEIIWINTVSSGTFSNPKNTILGLMIGCSVFGSDILCKECNIYKKLEEDLK